MRDWTKAKELPPSPIDFHQNQKFLSKLAYRIPGESRELSGEGMALQISRDELDRRLEAFLKEKGSPDTVRLVEPVIDRLHARDGILVHLGATSSVSYTAHFQEYFAALWVAQEMAEEW